jgi:hypothetical protein
VQNKKEISVEKKVISNFDCIGQKFEDQFLAVAKINIPLPF